MQGFTLFTGLSLRKLPNLNISGVPIELLPKKKYKQKQLLRKLKVPQLGILLF